MKLFIGILLLSWGSCGNALKIPRKIPLEFELKDVGTVKLNLKKKSELDDNSITVVTSTDDHYHSDLNETIGNYEDTDYKAEFSVTFTMAGQETQQIFVGLFMYNKKTYVLNPTEEDVAGDVLNQYPVTIKGVKYIVSETKDDFKFESKKEKVITRQKRKAKSSNTKVILELLAVLDYSVYQSFYETAKKKKKKALSAIMAYYSHIMAAINSKYRSIKTGKFRYSARLSGIYITTEKTDSFTEPIRSDKSVDFPDSLKELEKWLTSHDGKLPKYDIVASYTKLNSKYGETGYGYIGETCNKWALSITQDGGIYGTAEIGAHEIGHNLGSSHDGNGNSCSNKDQFLMTAVHQPYDKNNLHTFSPCSIKAFEEHMSKSEQACLLSTNTNKKMAVKKHLKKNMGEAYNVDAQCIQMVGKGSYFCKDHKQDEKICKELWCHYPDRGQCMLGASHRAYEGTMCGDNMECRKNECVFKKNKA